MLKKYPRKYVPGWLPTRKNAYKLIISLHTQRMDGEIAEDVFSYLVHLQKSPFFIQNLILNFSIPFGNSQNQPARL